MAKGKKCPCCGMPMYAQSEDNEPKGRWVTYVCQNGGCEKCGRAQNKAKAHCLHREKAFEAYAH